jgi:hypothetical protein
MFDDDEHLLSDAHSRKGALQRACLRVLDKHRADGALPTSVRFIYYELITAGAVDKKDANGAARVSAALMWLRERGLVDWNDIVDETRSVDQWETASSVAEYVANQVQYARIDPWEGTPPPIITESRSLAGVLNTLARQYAVPITSTAGQAGGYLRTDVAPILDDRVLYLGDYDFSGGKIEDNTRRVLEDIVGPLEWERLAITREQVDEYDLTIISKPDYRFKPVQHHDAVETEALGQSIIVDIVRRRLDELLPEPIDTVRRREQRQRKQMASILAQMTGRK